MITHFQHQRPTLAYRILSMLIVVAFTFSVIAPPTPVYAQLFPQGLTNLPLPGTMITMSPGFTPAMVTGVTIHPENPLEFDFIIGSGDDRLEGEAFEQESTKLIKYFLAALTVPEKEMWVNLSPYEEDRIIPAQFGNTEMGRDLLAQDYILKQLSASLMYPENELGERFWNRVRAKAYEKFGTTEIPMNTFNKIWIIPDEAIVYEQGESAFVVKSHLKVMLEEDYVALNKNLDVEKYGLDSLVENEAQIISGISSQVVREVLIPEIEKEVNGGETFANLRQIYNSVILATWYKQNLKDSLLGQVYVGKNKTAGVMVDDKQAKEKIYAQYLEAFEKGVYNYIKEDYDPVTEQVTPRKYFSGGTTFEAVGQLMTKFNTSSSPLKQAEQRTVTTFFAQAPAYRGNNIVTVGLVEVATGSDAASVTAFAQPIAASSPVKAVLPRVNPTKTKSWAKLKELLAHAKERYDLRTLFDADRSRAEKLSLELNDGFKVDFSKNLIDEETLAVLLELADEVSLGQAIEQMFSGEKINETEGRAVLHTALRNVTRDESGKIVAANGPVYVDGQDVMPKVIEVLNKVQAFSEKVRSGEWKGATGKRIKHIVNVGIGGSDLGPRMAARALTPFGRDSGIQVHFISNVDGTAAAELIRELGLNPEETLIVIESKTFTTQETIRNALTLKNWVSEFYADVAGVSDAEAISKHFVAVSTAEELVDAFGIDTENMFEFWDWVGGRYSLWSAIGLTLSAYVGFDNYFEMLEGAREADEHFRNQPFKQNIPVLQALISVWYRNFLNAETHAVVAYDEYLALFSSYLAQAQMESNGKGTDRDGNFITDYQTGPVLWGGAGTDMQHATMQQWHQGTSIIPAEIVSVRKSQNPIEEGDHHRKLYANSVAQPYALAFGFKLEEVKEALSDGEMSDQELQWLAAHRTFPGNKPTTSVLLEEMDPRTLGSLIALYEHKIMAEGIIYNIFSFDQWGVQLGKVIASRDVLPFLDGSRPLSELEDVPYGASIRDAIVTFNAKNDVTSSPAQAKEKLDPKLVAAQTVMTRHNLHNSKTLKALLRSLNGESFQQVRKDLERGLRGEKSKARLNTKSLVNEAARTLTQVQAASASSPVSETVTKQLEVTRGMREWLLGDRIATVHVENAKPSLQQMLVLFSHNQRSDPLPEEKVQAVIDVVKHVAEKLGLEFVDGIEVTPSDYDLNAENRRIGLRQKEGRIRVLSNMKWQLRGLVPSVLDALRAHEQELFEKTLVASSPVKVVTEERSKTELAEEISIEKAKQIFLDLIPGADEEAAPIADIRKTADLESKLATAALKALRDAGEIDIASEPGKVKIMRKLQVNTESNEKIQTKIVTILAEQLGKTEAEVETHLDTGFAEVFWSTDSLDVVELIMEIEGEFDMSVPDEEAEKIRTPRNMIDYIQNVTSSPVGGINLNPELIDLQIRRDGNGVPLPVNLQPVHQMKIDGFVPVIINVTPILNLPLLLGFSDTGSPLDSAQADLQAETYKLSLIDKCRNKYIYQHEHQNDDIDA